MYKEKHKRCPIYIPALAPSPHPGLLSLVPLSLDMMLRVSECYRWWSKPDLLGLRGVGLMPLGPVSVASMRRVARKHQGC
jgi:hypothetical protein